MIVTVEPDGMTVPTAGATLVTAALGSLAMASYAATSPAELSVPSYSVPVWVAKSGTVTSAASAWSGATSEKTSNAV